MEREAFLARVREAAHAGRSYRVHARSDFPGRIGYVGGGDDLARRLAAEVDAAGGESRVVSSDEQAIDEVRRIMAFYGVQQVLAWEHALLARLGIRDLAVKQGIAYVDHGSLVDMQPGGQRERMLAADLGITSAWRAVAETGTLAVASGAGTERVASLLPPVHVAIVERQQILPDLFDLFVLLESDKESLPSNLVFITGPSKTGDLELKLTTGVHGPGNWHVIVIAE